MTREEIKERSREDRPMMVGCNGESPGKLLTYWADLLAGFEHSGEIWCHGPGLVWDIMISGQITVILDMTTGSVLRIIGGSDE